MDPERWRRVEELYHSALERDPEQRHSFLVASCGTDEELLHEVETLLHVDASGNFGIDKPVWDRSEHTSDSSLENSPILTTGTLPFFVVWCGDWSVCSRGQARGRRHGRGLS